MRKSSTIVREAVRLQLGSEGHAAEADASRRIYAEMLLLIEMTRAGISDRKQFKQDDLKVELFYGAMYLENCAWK